MGSYIYLEPQMIAIFEGQPPQNKAELPLKTRDDGSFGFHIYIYRFIYIHGGGWLNHRLVHQGWITSSLGWCKPRDRICTAPKVFGDPGFWGDFFGSLESLRKTAWLDLYHIMICIYIFITWWYMICILLPWESRRCPFFSWWYSYTPLRFWQLKGWHKSLYSTPCTCSCLAWLKRWFGKLTKVLGAACESKVQWKTTRPLAARWEEVRRISKQNEVSVHDSKW